MAGEGRVDIVADPVEGGVPVSPDVDPISLLQPQHHRVS